MNRKPFPIIAIVLVLSGLLVLTSCNRVAKDASKSATMLIIQSVLGYTDAGVSAAFLQSDVQDMNFTVVPPVPVVLADTATVNLTAQLIDPNSPLGPTQYNNITLTGYSVTYTLPDGTGAPGVTVPNPIQNSLSTILITVGQTTAVPIIVVTEAAKQTAPLLALVGTTNTLQVNALIELTGQEPSGKQVKVSGNLSITFADYIDTPPVGTSGKAARKIR